MIKKVILPNGKQALVHLQRIGGTLWLHHSGVTWKFEISEGRSKRKSSGAQEIGNEITAPMPGKITKINVQTGDKVNRADVVIVMEAMKMEYSLKAHHGATVKEVKCQVGEQVTVGQELLRFEEQTHG